MKALMLYEAVVRYISVEPMLGRIRLNSELLPDWVIIGGESGELKNCRKLELAWVRELIEQCDANGIKVFFKQLGCKARKDMKLKDYAGGDFKEYPALLDWLKRREIPFKDQIPLIQNQEPIRKGVIQQELSI